MYIHFPHPAKVASPLWTPFSISFSQLGVEGITGYWSSYSACGLDVSQILPTPEPVTPAAGSGGGRNGTAQNSNIESGQGPGRKRRELSDAFAPNRPWLVAALSHELRTGRTSPRGGRFKGQTSGERPEEEGVADSR